MKEQLKIDIRFEEIQFEDIPEIEEVITPGWGTAGCCTN
ncbi:hypothetical protein PAECIP111894_04368 [Paenibacillus pseudetheri]|jgi:hypothetical protein|uniref:Lantibiotic n=1 Tax=Paenibacillus pseudetheri TaxID=2897682 RepID=A0ABN8FJC8_9BACL|nr:hypothetical protein PAECIP111894_04368 [Paenibacillus pseudetheri]